MRSRFGRFRFAGAVLLAPFAAMVIAACAPAEPDIPLTPLAIEGRDLARGSGCAACHGRNGQGGVAPTWQGLAGSTVTFTDGTSAVADAEYLADSIANPSARLRSGFVLKMPENNLNSEEIARVIAYIEELR